jgi:hypothetical protein
MGKPLGKKSLRRPRRRWVDNIKIDIRVIGWGSKDWIDMVHSRELLNVHVNAKINLLVYKMLGGGS